jgi:hypothetical protein
MKGNFTILRFLTDMKVCIGIFTAVFLSVLIPFQACRAATDETAAQSGYTSTPDGQDTPLANETKMSRKSQLLNYVRAQVPIWMPGLPSYIRDPGSWALGQLREVRDELGLDPGIGGEEVSMMSSLTQPVMAMMQSPGPEQTEAMWLSPDYHHKGFLPFHDAMVMGFGMRHAVMNDRIQVEVKPFYGQSWHSFSGYGGAEISVNLRGFGIGSDSGQPWGKIAVRYIEGNPDMLDHGHGTDLHAELRFTPHLALHAGVREDGDSGGLGNYAILRWQLAEFGPAH